ncbi:platelet factor 4-like [Ambystoma mexicanum]|uniref:platelet factor 4-like n=1 Tax=Ambystoma mexicanum TaxID=8296 RepID=UPI0037E88B77
MDCRQYKYPSFTSSTTRCARAPYQPSLVAASPENHAGMLAKLTVGALLIVVLAACENFEEYLDMPSLEVKMSFESNKLLESEKLRCQCIKTESQPIHPKQMKTLEYLPSGPHCDHSEVIVTLTTGQKVCVDPNAKWMESILAKILGRLNTSESDSRNEL